MTAVRVLPRAIVALIVLAAARAPAQSSAVTTQFAQHAPTFYLLTGDRPVAVDVRNVSILQQRIAVDFDSVTLPAAIEAIRQAAHVDISYNTGDVPASQRVSLTASKITLGAALTAVLLDVSLDVRISRHGALSIARRDEGATLSRPAEQQLASLHGFVLDSTSHTPLAQASIHIEHTGQSAITNDRGEYTIVGIRPGTYTIAARRLGYAPARQSLTVDTGRVYTVNFDLVATPAVLDEVVSTVTGNVANRTLGASIGLIPADSIVSREPVTNLSDLVSGRASGVQVFLPGGLVGASPALNIRGQDSYNLSNQPLVVIDGVRVNNSAASDNVAGPGEAAGRFNDIIPQEIEDIQVVRGPSAATLYGTDAANGVILIRTKRGAAGATRWSAYAEQGELTIDQSRFQSNYYAWGHAPDGTIGECGLQSLAASVCVQDSVTRFVPFRNPGTTPLGPGHRDAYGLQVSGGDRVRYFVSGGVESETGVLKMPAQDGRIIDSARGGAGLADFERRPNAYTKYSLRDNTTGEIGSTADVSLSVGYVHDDSRIPATYSIVGAVDGPGTPSINNGWLPGFRASTFFLSKNIESLTHVTGGLTGNWRPISAISAHATLGADYSSTGTDALDRTGDPYSLIPSGFRGNSKDNATLYSVDLGATATIGSAAAITAKTSAGAQYNQRNELATVAQAVNLIPGCQTVTCGSIPIVSEMNSEAIVAGVYGEEMLGWRDRLFFTGALRADGGSNFGSNYHVALYPKASVSWVVSEEHFWPSIPGVSSLRLRAAYGETGVQPQNTAALGIINAFPAFIDGAPTTGATVQQFSQSHLEPERQREVEAGFDISGVDNRFHVNATYYDKRSEHALYTVPTPASFGVQGAEENVGSVRNWGYEATVGGRPIAASGFTWDIDLNGSINHNQLVTLGPGITAYYGFAGQGALVQGYPIFSSFDYPFTYHVAPSQTILQPSDVTQRSTPAFIGPTYPGTQLTATSTVLLLRHLHVLAQFDYRGAFKLANEDAAFRCLQGFCRDVTTRGASLFDQARAIAYANSGQASVYGYYEDGEFIRFRELSVTYDVPASVARSLRARNASLTLAARNLALWTHYSGVDPEVSGQLGIPSVGAYYAGNGALPAPTYWIVRLSLGL